jgi:hypothetical protein
MTGTNLNGMMKGRKTETSSICGITASSRMRAEECFFHDYTFRRDEQHFSDVYVLDGITDRGRRLRLVFQDKGNRVARIFTGWDLKRTKKRKK